MPASSRYPRLNGKACIDIHLKSSKQLFDLRDPAPFRERDLDPSAADYLMASLREIPRREPVCFSLFISGEPTDFELHESVLIDAIRAHFEYERTLVESNIRAHFRRGRQLFAIGLGVLTALLSLARLSDRLAPAFGHVHAIVKEGLVITGWVAMWRPLEVLLYDWWPLYEKRRWIDKLLTSEIAVHRGIRSRDEVSQTP
jgi:hypothetical protein